MPGTIISLARIGGADMALKNYINGRWMDASGGRTFRDVNPANGEFLGELPRSGPEEVAAAVEAAWEAFPRWRRVPAPRRADMFYRLGDLMERQKEELARLLTMEMGKVLVEARGEVQEALDYLYMFAGEGRRQFGFTTPSELPNKAAMAVREPLGVVACITPWNFPIAIPVLKIFAALILGNTVVFKPASDTPIMACRLVELMEEAGFPPGVMNLVHGTGQEVGVPLVQHPKVALISFTGSTEVGREIGIVAAQNMKRSTMEMGGKNAITVLEDADLDLAVEGIIWSAFGTTGQRCTACSRLLVHRDVKDALLSKLVPRVEALRLGNGLDPDTDVGPLINGARQDKVAEYVEIGRREGARLVTGGYPVREGDLSKGFFFKPTIFDEVDPYAVIAQEEIFGPVLSVITVGSLEEAIRINNSVKYGLTSSVYTRDLRKAFVAMRELDTGLVYINAGTIGAETHLPFGGTKATGNGHREGAWAALDAYSEWKTIYVDYSGRLQRAQIDIEAPTA
jgi:aldehyde dehydrogenase (NAD+)